MDELHHESKHKSHRLISPLLPPLGWPKIFFSSSLLSFIFNQIRYKYCKQCRTHDSTEPRRKGNAKLQILVFGHATYSFEFVTFRRFFYIFSRYFSSNLPVLFKNLPLTGSCYCIPSCDRNHTFAHRNTPPPRRGGGPEGRRGFTPTHHPHGKQKGRYAPAWRTERPLWPRRFAARPPARRDSLFPPRSPHLLRRISVSFHQVRLTAHPRPANSARAAPSARAPSPGLSTPPPPTPRPPHTPRARSPSSASRGSSPRGRRT